MTYSAEVVAGALQLLAAGRSKKSVAKELGVSRAALRGWAASDPERLIADRRGRGAHDPASCELVPPVPPSSYAYLFGQYLGDGSIARHPRDVYRLRISCCDDYPEIMTRCATAMAEVMPANRVGRVANVGCTEVYSFSKHWPCMFPQHGPGMKHNRLIELAPWQWAIIRVEPRQFIAGLIHSDGCRCINRVSWSRNRRTKIYEYPRYFFSNQSQDILQICGDALDLIGVEWRFNNRNSISIAKKASVAILDEFIGPKS